MSHNARPSELHYRKPAGRYQAGMKSCTNIWKIDKIPYIDILISSSEYIKYHSGNENQAIKRQQNLLNQQTLNLSRVSFTKITVIRTASLMVWI